MKKEIISIAETHIYAYELCLAFAALALILILIAIFVRARRKAKIRKTIENLKSMIPEQALLVIYREEDELEKALYESITADIATKDLRTGDVVKVKAGTNVPVDGIIIQGHGSADESVLTGERAPVSKNVGDRVLCGSVNSKETLYIKTDCAGEDTTVSHTIKDLEDRLEQQPFWLLKLKSIIKS